MGTTAGTLESFEETLFDNKLVKIAAAVLLVLGIALAYRFAPRPPVVSASEWRLGRYVVVGFRVSPANSTLRIDGASLYGTQTPNGPKHVFVPDISKMIILVSKNLVLGSAHVMLAREYTTNGKTFEFRDQSPIHIELSHLGYRTWSTDLVPHDNIIEISANLQPLAPGEHEDKSASEPAKKGTTPSRNSRNQQLFQDPFSREEHAPK